MRILIDLQGCQSGSRFGGIGRYSMSLAKAMLQLQSGHEISLLLNSRLPNENMIRAEFAGLLPPQNIKTFEVPAYVAAENDMPAHTRMAELIREKRIAEINPDVLHIASLFEGVGEDAVTSVGMFFPAERTAVTLYDLIPFVEKETYLANKMHADHYLRKLEGLKRAGMIVAISAFSREEALAHAQIPAETITNISSAVDQKFAPQEIAANAKSELLGRFAIDKPFLLFTGSFDSRKNHARLVKAFAKISPPLRQRYQMLFIGKDDNHRISHLKTVAQQHGLTDRDIVFVGHVTDADLVAAYNLCALFVFPSLREGFGLPVLEAMSCGAPTIGSKTTSIPEVISRADMLFDPEDVDDIAAKMTSVLENEAFRGELKQHGLARAKHFSWQLSATRALEFFERRLESLRTSSRPINPLRHVPSPPHENIANYDDFLAAFSTLDLGKLDTGFLASAGRAIALNELLTRIESEHFHRDMRIGWVTNWDAGCVTGSYSQRIIAALTVPPIVFAPRSATPIADDKLQVVRCWNREAKEGYAELQSALAGAPIDVVVIQYDQGTLEWAALANIITQQKHLHRHVFVTLHSTEQLPALLSTTGIEVKGALRACDGIFVHSINDVKKLDAFQVRKNVNFVPNLALRTQMDKTPDRDQVEMIADHMFRKMAFAIARGSSTAIPEEMLRN